MFKRPKTKNEEMYQLGFLVASILKTVEKACLNDDRYDEAELLNWAHNRQFDLLEYIENQKI